MRITPSHSRPRSPDRRTGTRTRVVLCTVLGTDVYSLCPESVCSDGLKSPMSSQLWSVRTVVPVRFGELTDSAIESHGEFIGRRRVRTGVGWNVTTSRNVRIKTFFSQWEQFFESQYWHVVAPSGALRHSRHGKMILGSHNRIYREQFG